MLDILDSVRQSYINGDTRYLDIKIQKNETEVITVAPTDAYYESLVLSEALIAKSNIEYIGCNASQLKITIKGLKKGVKGKRITIKIYTQETIDNPIPIFDGYIDDVVMASNKKSVDIIAYDVLYYLKDYDVTEWFYDWVKKINSGTQLSIKGFRNKLFEHIGLKQETASLPNDSFVIKKLGDTEVDLEEVEKVYAFDLIMHICQINGCLGIVNKKGNWEYRTIGAKSVDDGAYPSATLYPPFIVGVGEIEIPADSIFLSAYKACTYKDYSVKGITKVYVRQTDKSKAGYFGTLNKYKYYVQGNYFTLGTSRDERKELAKGIYNRVKGIEYTPFSCTCEGMPWLEVGDTIQIYAYDFEESDKQGKDVYEIKDFIVLQRRLKGIQGMTDVLTAQGEEKQKKFVSDLGITDEVSNAELKTQVDTVSQQTVQNTDQIQQMQGSIWDVQSVDTLPSSCKPMTLYFVKGTKG